MHLISFMGNLCRPIGPLFYCSVVRNYNCNQLLQQMKRALVVLTILPGSILQYLKKTNKKQQIGTLM